MDNPWSTATLLSARLAFVTTIESVPQGCFLTRASWTIRKSPVQLRPGTPLCEALEDFDGASTKTRGSSRTRSSFPTQVSSSLVLSLAIIAPADCAGLRAIGDWLQSYAQS